MATEYRQEWRQIQQSSAVRFLVLRCGCCLNKSFPTEKEFIVTTKVLFVVGSLRKNAFNLQLAQQVADLVKDRAEVEFLDYADLPLVNQDIEFPAPASVAAVRQKVVEANGVWFFSPEYNGSYTGALKNLVDWLSRPMEANNPEALKAIRGKKVTMSGAAGGSKALNSLDKLDQLLKFIAAEVAPVEATGIQISMDSVNSGTLELSEEDVANLRAQADGFLAFLQQ